MVRHISLISLRDQVREWRREGKKIIFTNGCFDVIHPGHIYLLEQCKALSTNSKVIVAINSDESIRELKGEGRPVNKLADRLAILAALRSVDAVIDFHNDLELHVQTLLPDFLVKGEDYLGKKVVGAEFAKAVAYIPLLEGYSTTNSIERSDYRGAILNGFGR